MPALDLPTPSPLPSSSNSSYSLSERINIATRPIHSHLNKLILQRLPLALPPYTSNPSTYISGLLYIAPVYETFESLWQSLLDAPRLPTTLQQTLSIDACDPEYPILDANSIPLIPNKNSPPLVHAPKVCSRTHSLLSHLRLLGLLRTGRLRADIRVLTSTPEHKIGEQLEAVSRNGRLARFISHTKRSVEANPHVLVAYAWVLYMALFSGGRYLRACLNEAGGSSGDFWNRDPSSVRLYSITRQADQDKPHRPNSECFVDSEILPPGTFSRFRSEGLVQSGTASRSRSRNTMVAPGLQFFNFLGNKDGEDLKQEFKKRVAEAEILLTREEKEDIISEAEEIFKFIIEIVGELDIVMGTKDEDLKIGAVQQSSTFTSSRDSVAATRERLLRRKSIQRENRRKASFLEALVTGPVAKLVHFNDSLPALDEVMKPLGGRFSRHGHIPQVSFENVNHGEQVKVLYSVCLTGITTFAVIGVVLAWYYAD